MRVGVGVGFG
uniref:Uncharacterized protein n=1 Tax=Arundo donax TaxID=35708 RepID=A0A0A9EG40_ARUDO